MKRKKRLDERNHGREGALLVYAVFLTGVASQTVSPVVLMAPEGENFLHACGTGGIDLVPFTVLHETYRKFTGCCGGSLRNLRKVSNMWDRRPCRREKTKGKQIV